MKKLVLFCSFMILLPFSVKAISAESAIVMDMDSKRVLYELNSNKEKLIASTTKIMTALVAIEYGDLDMVHTVDKDVLKAYGSAIYIEVGEELTLKDLLYGLMLRSGNDAAIQIANAVAGSMDSFVYLMNEKAKEMGMKHTTFLNNHGLENEEGKGNTSTVYDMALLMCHAMENPQFKEITQTKEITVKSNTKTYVWVNKNRLLHEYRYATGGKTGYTEKAKRTLVTSASKDDKNLVVVTFNDGNDFNDHKSLYEEYFEKYHVVEVLDKDRFEVENEEHYHDARLWIEKSFRLLVTDQEEKDLKVKIALDKLETYEDGDVAGTVKVTLKNNVLFQQKIYLEKEETPQKLSWWQKLLGWFKRW